MVATVDGKLAKLVRLVRQSLGLSDQTVGWGLPRGYDVVRLAAALLLLVAAGLKAHQLATEPVLGTGLLESRWFLIGVVEFELFFGLWLLSGLLPKVTWAAALGCFVLFTCISLFKALSGHATCGCFGKIEVNPWYTATLDIFVVLSLLCWPAKGSRTAFQVNFGQLPVRVAGVLAVWLAVGVPAGCAMGSYTNAALSDAGDTIGNGRIVVLEPEKWVGKKLPLLEYIDIGDRLREGDWLLLLYHQDCPDCREAIENALNETAREGGNARLALALIEVPPYGNAKARIGLQEASFVLGRLSGEREWLVTTPAQLELKSGQVVATSVR